MMQDEMKFIGGVDFKELKSQRVKVYDTFTINLATARTDEEFTVTGNYIYVLEATDIDTLLQIRLNERPRSLIKLNKGRGIRAPFYRLYLTNAAQAGKTITIAIGVESDTFEVFDVGKALEVSGTILANVIEGNATITALETANIGGDFAGGEVAKYSLVQLWNAAASGKNLLLTHLRADVALAANTITLYSHTAELGSTPWGPKGNKYLGKTAGIGQIGSWSDAAPPGTPITDVWGPLNGSIVGIDFNPPILIPQGVGLHAQCNTLNTNLNVSFEWLEHSA